VEERSRNEALTKFDHGGRFPPIHAEMPYSRRRIDTPYVIPKSGERVKAETGREGKGKRERERDRGRWGWEEERKRIREDRESGKIWVVYSGGSLRSVSSWVS